jgi:hypothetical protein
MNKKQLIRNIALFVAIAGIAGITATSAFGGEKGEGRPEFTPDPAKQAQMEAQRTAVETAMTAGDYSAWKALMENKNGRGLEMLDKITADNFAKFVEMHNLMKAGDKDGAKAIADELGLPGFMGMGGGMMKGGHGGRFEERLKNGGFKDTNGDGVCGWDENKPVAPVSGEVSQ